jgi:hypothetical protein
VSVMTVPEEEDAEEAEEEETERGRRRRGGAADNFVGVVAVGLGVLIAGVIIDGDVVGDVGVE